MKQAHNKEIKCPIICVTPDDGSYFFGYHDIIPWNSNDDTLAVLKVPKVFSGMPTSKDRAEVCLWKPDTGSVRTIAETTAWNWQQGARVQWLPNLDNRLVYNVRRGEALGAVIQDVDTGRQEVKPFTIYTISADGHYALTFNFVRLGRHWPAYGYAGARSNEFQEPLPDDDGIYLINMESNRVDLIVSISQVAAIASAEKAHTKAHFLSHPTFNPSGTRFCFMHRFFTADNGLYTRLFVANRDGTGLRLLVDEMCSHFDWYNDTTLFVWMRRVGRAVAASRRRGILAWPLIKTLLNTVRRFSPKLKQSLLRQAYYYVNVDFPEEAASVARGLLEADGHPMFSRNRKWMVTDTYPGPDGNQNLILYHLGSQVRYDVRIFPSPPEFVCDVKCDLHPRWNHANDRVCVDTVQSGYRQVAILDAAPVISTMNEG